MLDVSKQWEENSGLRVVIKVSKLLFLAETRQGGRLGDEIISTAQFFVNIFVIFYQIRFKVGNIIYAIYIKR